MADIESALKRILEDRAYVAKHNIYGPWSTQEDVNLVRMICSEVEKVCAQNVEKMGDFILPTYVTGTIDRTRE